MHIYFDRKWSIKNSTRSPIAVPNSVKNFVRNYFGGRCIHQKSTRIYFDELTVCQNISFQNFDKRKVNFEHRFLEGWFFVWISIIILFFPLEFLKMLFRTFVTISLFFGSEYMWLYSEFSLWVCIYTNHTVSHLINDIGLMNWHAYCSKPNSTKILSGWLKVCK